MRENKVIMFHNMLNNKEASSLWKLSREIFLDILSLSYSMYSFSETWTMIFQTSEREKETFCEYEWTISISRKKKWRKKKK